MESGEVLLGGFRTSSSSSFKKKSSSFANATLFNYDIEILGEVDIMTALLFHFLFSHFLSQEPILFYFLTFPAILHS